MITAYQKLILDMQNEISEEITIMKRVISFFSLRNYANVIYIYGIG